MEQFLLPAVLVALLVFMIFSSRNRNKKMQAERAAKQAQTVPGVKVLLQGGLYGTVVSYDSENLDQPAEIELAPGVVVEVHSQAILRVVEPETDEIDDEDGHQPEAHDERAEFDIEVPDDASAIAPAVETVEDTRRRLEGEQDDKNKNEG